MVYAAGLKNGESVVHVRHTIDPPRHLERQVFACIIDQDLTNCGLSEQQLRPAIRLQETLETLRTWFMQDVAWQALEFPYLRSNPPPFLNVAPFNSPDFWIWVDDVVKPVYESYLSEGGDMAIADAVRDEVSINDSMLHVCLAILHICLSLRAPLKPLLIAPFSLTLTRELLPCQGDSHSPSGRSEGYPCYQRAADEPQGGDEGGDGRNTTEDGRGYPSSIAVNCSSIGGGPSGQRAGGGSGGGDGWGPP